MIDKARAEIQTLDHLKEKLAGVQEERVTYFLQILLIAILSLDASDAHIQPEKGSAKVRLRIDGLLHDVCDLAPAIYEALLSRIKLISKIKLNVADKPQDG
ncbi:MAG: ATPase, T2SS/T4P/T4SS family, partial [Nanoarchaeota archaeon]